MIKLDYHNIVEPVVARAERTPDLANLIFVAENGRHLPITAGDFHAAAARWSQALQHVGVGQDDIVLLVLAHSRKLLFSFWGALYLGAIPSIYPMPTSRLDTELYVAQVKALVAQSGVKAVITHTSFKAALQSLLAGLGCPVIGDEDLPALTPGPADIRPAAADSAAATTAFLQFSSGTTGAKKGVLVPQAAVLDQIDVLSRRLGVDETSVFVNWLPLHHDMGLVGSFLLPFVRGIGCVLISPTHWIRDPRLLLWAIDRYQGTHTYMPNFAFNHLVRAVRPDDIEGLDLSTWRQILNGAEPIRYETIQSFAARFTPYGLRREALTTGYGMAENTLAIAVKPFDAPIRVDWVDLRALQEERRARPVPPDSPGAVAQVASGPPMPGTEARVVDGEGRSLPDRQVGQIWLRGASLFDGYHRQPELTAAVFHDDWFNTGDLGYVVDGWLYITGREKDLIIVGGKNIHPEDIEEIANAVPGLRPGRVVAFGLWNDRLGSEDVIVVGETRGETSPEENAQIAAELRRRLARRLDCVPADVRLVNTRWVVKSSSGKLARPACRDRYLADFHPAGGDA